MATKIKMMKLLQEMRGFADIANRRPQPRSPGLFLLQMRSQVLHTPFSPRKRTLQIEIQDTLDIPHPVKIKHITGSPLPMAALSAR